MRRSFAPFVIRSVKIYGNIEKTWSTWSTWSQATRPTPEMAWKIRQFRPLAFPTTAFRADQTSVRMCSRVLEKLLI
jgi:hypothetical protein